MPMHRLVSVAIAACLAFAGAGAASQKQETSAMTRATGTFDVTLTPQSLASPDAEATLGRMSIDKQFHFAYSLAGAR